MIKGMTPQEFGIFVSNGLIVPFLFIVLTYTLIRRDKKRDKLEQQRVEELKAEKEEADERLIKELEASRLSAEERENFLRREASKREEQLMQGFKEITSAIHKLVDELGEVKETVGDLQDLIGNKPTEKVN